MDTSVGWSIWAARFFFTWFVVITIWALATKSGREELRQTFEEHMSAFGRVFGRRK